MEFHPNGEYIGSGSQDTTCRLWDAASGQCVRVLSGSKVCLSLSLAVSHSVLLPFRTTHGEGQDVSWVWSVHGSLVVLVLQTLITAVAFSPDGQTLVGGGEIICL